MNAILNRQQQHANQLQSGLLQHTPEQKINLELQKQSQLLTRLKTGMHNMECSVEVSKM